MVNIKALLPSPTNRTQPGAHRPLAHWNDKMKQHAIFTRLRRVALLGLLSAGILLTTAPVHADGVNQPAGWGLGLMLGSPTGITAKGWLGGANAWDVGLGFGGIGFHPAFRVHANYLWGLAQILPDTSDVTLDLYLGAGALVGAGRYGPCDGRFDSRYYNDCGVGHLYGGVRVPLGLDLRFQNAPIQLGLEVAPGVTVSEHYVSGLLDVALTARYLF